MSRKRNKKPDWEALKAVAEDYLASLAGQIANLEEEIDFIVDVGYLECVRERINELKEEEKRVNKILDKIDNE